MGSQQFRDHREIKKSGAGRVVALTLLVVVLAGTLAVGMARWGGELPMIGPFIGDTTTTSDVTIEEIRNLNHLTTTRWIGSVVVTEEAEPGRIQSLADSIGVDTSAFTGESVIVTATGEVEAGVDLDELRQGDVRVNGETVTIRLPEPEIFSSGLNEDRTGVYDRDRGIFVYRGNDTLIEEARGEAVEKIEQAARESGILDQARTNTEDSLRTFIETLGFEEVRFE